MGIFGEFILGLLKMVLTDKMKGRLQIHSQGLESLYKMVDKETLPKDFMPDDYRGPTAGSYSDFIGMLCFNPLTAGVAYIRFSFFISALSTTF